MSDEVRTDRRSAALEQERLQARQAEENRLRQSAAFSELLLLSPFGRQVAQAAVDSATATSAGLASARTRGTLDARATAGQRGLGVTPPGGINFDPTPAPIKIPSKLDKIKSLLTPTPPSENESKHQLEIEKVLNEVRQRTNPGRTDPKGTIKPLFPVLKF